MLVRFRQFSNAPSPIYVMLAGILMALRFSRYENAQQSIVVIPSGITLLFVPAITVFVSLSIKQLPSA